MGRRGTLPAMKETNNIGVANTVKLADLNTFHNNPRHGDVEAIKDSIVANGVFKPLIVNKGTKTGRENEVLAGNHTLLALQSLAQDNPDEKQWQTVEVWQVDVDDEQATRIVLADNRTADLGGYDTKILQELLESIDDNLDGTGYDYDDLDGLISQNSATLDTFRDFVDNVQDPEPDENNDSDPLDGDTSEDEHTGDTPTPTTDLHYEEYLAVTFSVTADERNRIRVALNHIKAQNDLETQAQALIWLIENSPALNVDELVQQSKDTITAEVDGDNTAGDN